ncbi:MAG: peptidoglycan DD-metalloendopeptidase family protein [Chloroflexota bacterium]
MKMPRFLILTGLILIISLLAVGASFQPVLAAGEPPGEPVSSLPPELQAALDQRVNEIGVQSLGFLMYEPRVVNVEYSADGTLALIWFAFVDPETGQFIEGEPGLAVARLSAPAEGEKGIQGWDVTLQADEEWGETLLEVPQDLLSDELRQMYLTPSEDKSILTTTVFRGYKLPWPAGVSHRVSQSVSHSTCANWVDCRYAWDFAENSPNQNWPVLAAKGGIVKRVKWDIPTRSPSACPGDGTVGNYIVLEDRSTTPWTYQLYLHLAQDSIPERLRTPGAIVQQGEYIGLVDNTGASCGSHLHFHVHTNPNSYWGTSVDIRFDDVAVNDGRPRTCFEATNWSAYGNQCEPNNRYTSGNIGTNPPAGSLTLPAHGEEITSSTVLVAGTAWDDQQVTSIQIIARGLDGVWKDVGAAFTQSPFAVEVDLCAAGIPNGPVDIALRVWDNHGNVTIQPQGLRTVLKKYNCPAAVPACTLSDNKIILYSQPNYQGSCREYLWNGEITVPDLATGGSPVGSNNTQSIRVGANVRAVLYDATSYSGRAEAFERDDPNLADNPIGAKTASSLKVQARSFTSLNSSILYPANGSSIPSTDSITLFMSSPLATAFGFTLNRDGQLYQSYDNLPFPAVSIGSLPPGNYSVRGCAKVAASGADCADRTGWVNFTVTSASLPNNSLKTAPYNDGFNSSNGDWHATGGWQHTGTHWRYGNGTTYSGSGSLTSPPIRLPESGSPYLYFNYRYRTESPAPWWDQRRLQISVDGGPFSDLPGWGQFSNDPATANTWLSTPNIDLSAYRGRTIRIRFYFNALDGNYNQGVGWEIENFQIAGTAPSSGCAVNPNNTSLSAARWVNIGDTLVGETLCVPGTQMFYQFFGFQGQSIRAEVNAKVIGSQLDPYLYLLDSSGGMIAENDDIVYSEQQDSRIEITLPYTGIYYLRVKAWDHPGAGGPDYFYVLRLMEFNTPADVQFIVPASNWIAGGPFEVRVEVNAQASGIEKVDFYYHAADWANSGWQLIGSDTDGSNGWSLTVNPASYGGMVGGAIYAQARGTDGQVWGDWRLNLQIDGNKPTSQLTGSLSNPGGSTAVRLAWSAQDDVSGISRVDFQYRVNDGGWQDWNFKPAAESGVAWFLGQAGQKYEFRIRAVDRAGNVQDWPAGGQVTTLPAACTAGSGEPGNNQQQGAAALLYETAQEHKLCPAADRDWLRFEAEAGKPYLFFGTPVSGGAALKLGIYDGAGNRLYEQSAPGLGQGLSFVWSAPASGSYYLLAAPLDDGLFGDEARYSLWYGEPRQIFLPMINR